MKARIAIFHPFFHEKGGAEWKALLLAQGAKKAGYRVKIITFSWKPEQCFADAMKGVDVKVVEYGRNPIAKLLALKTMAKEAKGFDLVHAHNYPANIAAGIAKKMYDIPTLYYCNEPFLYEDGTLKRHNAAYIHLMRYIEARYVKYIDLFVGNSKHTANKIKKAFGRTAKVSYSGRDMQLFKPKKAKNATPIIYTQNRIKKEKRIEDLLPIMRKVWAKYPKAKLVIGGDGNHLAQLKRTMRDKRITFQGMISQKQLVKNYQKADVFVFTAHNEPLGMTPVEAMACGTPVVAHNSGGPRETVVDGNTGYLYNDVSQAADQILALLDDKKSYAKISKHARDRAVKLFSEERMVKDVLQYYEELLNK